MWESDNEFSLHKDRVLHCYWGEVSFGARFVLAGSKTLQQIAGIDGVLQITPYRAVSFDTKHIRGNYQNFYLEELSCPQKNTLGWTLKESPCLDIVFYCFWPFCSKYCAGGCNTCTKILKTKIYGIPFQELREWFVAHKDEYRLHTNDTSNGTNGRIVPIKTIEENVGAIKVREFDSLPAKVGWYSKKRAHGDFSLIKDMLKNMAEKDKFTPTEEKFFCGKIKKERGE